MTDTPPDTIRVFVNAAGVDIPRGGRALDAVNALDPAMAGDVSSGTRRVTDSRGLPADLNAPLESGAILRVVSARAAAAPDEE